MALPFDTRVDLDGIDPDVERVRHRYGDDRRVESDGVRPIQPTSASTTAIASTPAVAPGRSTATIASRASTLPPAPPTRPHHAINFYAGYSEGSRAPTSIELGCANPDQPCKLPNAMAGDPPLGQVITRTLEAGLRGGTGSSARFSWNAGVFVSRNRNDMLFVASPQTGFGYFKNFGETRRQGFELGAQPAAWNAFASAAATRGCLQPTRARKR